VFIDTHRKFKYFELSAVIVEKKLKKFLVTPVLGLTQESKTQEVVPLKLKAYAPKTAFTASVKSGLKIIGAFLRPLVTSDQVGNKYAND